MNGDFDTVAGWFVVNGGKVYGRCPSCLSPNICYHKNRPTGLKGISGHTQGLTPACLDCGKGLPVQVAKAPKAPVIRRTKRKATAS